MPQADPDAMDVDVDPDATVMQTSDIQDYGVEVDYEDLDEDLKDVGDIPYPLLMPMLKVSVG